MTSMATARSFHSPTASLLTALAILAGCSAPTADTAPADASSAPQAAIDSRSNAPQADTIVPATLREAELGGAAPVHAVGNIYLAGQPQQDDLEAMAERGIKTVVSLRKADEMDWDEAAAVEAAGMNFVRIPFGGPKELTDDVFDRVRAVLAENRDEPLVLHCARANRVGAVWMVHRVLNEGVGIDQALKEAQTAGLRTAEYVERARQYIERAQAEGAADDSHDQEVDAD